MRSLEISSLCGSEKQKKPSSDLFLDTIGMSSATVTLFVSVAIAMIGAAELAFVLTHPDVVASVSVKFLQRAHILPLNALPLAKSADAPDRLHSANAAGTVSIASSAFGHFATEAEINGRTINVMVDTGASLVALTYDDADRLGIFVRPSDFTYQAQTANGIARVAPVTIPSISIGSITVRNVQGIVSERGRSERTLLGMSFLGRLSRVEMRGQTLVLQE